MEYDYKRIPKIVEKKEIYPDGANSPTRVDVHKCFCKKGFIEHCTVPGFGDEWFEIKCNECSKKYHDFIDLCGDEWKVYLK